jgi:hypothetical protein
MVQQSPINPIGYCVEFIPNCLSKLAYFNAFYIFLDASFQGRLPNRTAPAFEVRQS